MKKRIYILSAFVLILSLWAVALWLLPFRGYKDVAQETRYGVSEGMQLVEQVMARGERQWVVEDADGDILFRIPLRGCLIDTRFRNGRLAFREVATGREGYIDRQGMVAFEGGAEDGKRPAVVVPEDRATSMTVPPPPEANVAPTAGGKAVTKAQAPTSSLSAADIRQMAQNSPFYAEAAKILKGKLSETDAASRRQILTYCEHLRTAYTTKDIDFLRQVFSDNALIIVGNVVKTTKGAGHVQADSRVSYALHTKRTYLARLTKVFAANKKVDVRFTNFRILRHPTRDGIYGVSMRQRYRSDRYADDGWLFLLWDFRNPSMPLIHVRTWQPSATVEGGDGVIDISDFNLE